MNSDRVAHRYIGPEARQVAAAAQAPVEAMGMPAPPESPTTTGITILHAAVQVGNVPDADSQI